VGFLYFSWIFCGDLFSKLWYLTIGIRALSSATKMGNFNFFQILEEEKEGHDTRTNTLVFGAEIAKLLIDLISSQKTTNFKK
jgi:hypothetical protein